MSRKNLFLVSIAIVRLTGSQERESPGDRPKPGLTKAREKLLGDSRLAANPAGGDFVLERFRILSDSEGTVSQGAEETVLT